MKISSVRTAFLFIAAWSLAMIAGFFYAYEVSVMRGFARLTDREFIAAMQAVNATVRNTAFALSFFGAAALSAIAAILHLPLWRTPQAVCSGAAAVVYILGGLTLTMTVSVPLNEWLASVGPAVSLADPAAIRARYEAPWVHWNVVRMTCSVLAFLLMVAALWLDGARRRRNGAESQSLR